VSTLVNILILTVLDTYYVYPVVNHTSLISDSVLVNCESATVVSYDTSVVGNIFKYEVR